MTRGPTTLRDRKRQAVRAEVTAVAVDLLLANGYDEVTVDQIAAAAGLSPRSFFRYFANKEAVVTSLIDEAGAGIADRLSGRPPDEEPWPALRRSFDQVVEQLDDDGQALPMMRLIYRTPELYGSHLHKQTQWNELIAEALTPRLATTVPGEQRRLQAGALAAAGVSCFGYARLEWVTGNGSRTVAELLDLAMNAVRPLPGP